MADYDVAFDLMIHNEDRKLSAVTTVDNNGGKVRLGLNAKAHPQLETEGFYTCPKDEAISRAKTYYRLWYWTMVRGDLINDQAVANKIFDQAVPMGPVQAVKILQRTLGFSEKDVDGHLGPITLNALNNAPAGFIDGYKTNLVQFYKDLVTITHPEYANNLKGWTIRAEA